MHSFLYLVRLKTFCLAKPIYNLMCIVGNFLADIESKKLYDFIVRFIWPFITNKLIKIFAFFVLIV